MSSGDKFGPPEALAYLLLLDIQEDRELSLQNWQWLYSSVSRNKPATLEAFKQEVTKKLKCL